MNLTRDVASGVAVAAFVVAALSGHQRIGATNSRNGGSRFGTWRPHPSPPGRRVPLPNPARGRGWRPREVAPLRRRSSSATEPSSWARKRDLRPLLLPKGRGGEDPPVGRLVLGRVGRRTIASERAQSLIVFGPTQSHKTSGLAVPAILGWEGPVIAASVKTDLLEHTIGHRRTCGEVRCFDPTGSTGLESAAWSPLPRSRTWPGARRAAAGMTDVAKTSVGTMTDGDFWYATATKMLAPLLFAAASGTRDMSDVIRWVDTQEETEVLDLLHAAGVPEAFHAAQSIFGKEDRQRSSIYTTVETILEPFADAARRENGESSGETIDPRRVVEGANTLYLCAPAHDQRRLTPLFASVVREVVDHVYDQVTRTGRPIDPPLLVVLDEAANIAPVSDLDALASTAAGHGVQLITIWHDLAQIQARYGNRAATVTNNHRAKLFLSGISDPATLDYASHLIGDEEVVLPSVTTGGQSGPSSTRSSSTRKLAAPDRLRRIPPGEGVLVYGGLHPACLRLRTWFGDPWLRAKAHADPMPER
jgi:type IV secretion system protein VirD4